MRPRRLLALATALTLEAACHRTPPPVSVAPLPPEVYARYLAGKHALYRDDAVAAARELAAAARAAPDQPMIVVELARALVKARRVAEARLELAAARAAWPRHAHVWLASGEVLEQEEATRVEAMTAYRRAIALDPTDERAYLGLARAQLAASDPTGAERTLRALTARLPGSVEGHYRLALRSDARGDRAATAIELRKVLERDPDHLDARIELARALRRLGKLHEAVAQLRSAFDRAGQPMDLAEELFWLLCEADDRQGAIDLLTLLDDERSDVDALASVAQWNRGLGRSAEARAVAVRIQALDAEAGALALAEADLADGLIDRGLAAALAVPATSARYLHARRVAVDAHVRARRFTEALALLAPLRAARPDDTELAFTAALVHAQAGDAPRARAIAATFRGEPAALAYARARVYEELGDTRRALAVLEAALRGAPEHAGALNLAGYLLASRRERLPDAARYLARARDLQPGDPAILDSWGWLLLQRGRARDAVRTLDRAARFAPREPEIVFHLAAAWAADRAPRRAAELLDRATALGPAPALQARIDALRRTLGLR